MTRTMLKDEQWHKLRTILRQINVYDKPNLRVTVEAMLYRIRVGCPWRDIPEYFGKWYVIYQQYRYWRITGKWQKLMSIITQDYDSEWLFIDGSVVKAHQHSSGATSHQDEAIGKSVAGNSSKIHLVVDACGNPVHIEVTGGQLHDSQMANVLIKRAIKDDTEAVVADKGYDSQDIRNCIMDYNATVVIPVKSNSKSSNENMDWYLYRCRHLVENAFARLKHFRGIATRYDKLKASYEAAVILACVYIWLPLI
ncbi:IS5 family transposase [Psychrobacter lutiphocae]|uniref:IS5 family transposase n=1 Tax=Psychrobacter lutiphocae TaxID=540500 RepID=UPI0003689144|nr:IS5 family transposase [Psychrobacter lutiphocae]